MLNRASGQCLWQITGQYATAPTDAVWKEAGFPEFDVLTQREAAKAREKSMRLLEHNSRRAAAAKEEHHRSKRSSRRELAQEVNNWLGPYGQGPRGDPPDNSSPFTGCELQVDRPPVPSGKQPVD